MQFHESVSLQSLNTLSVPAKARYFVSVSSVEELQEAVAFSRQQHMPRLVLGGGSNIVLSGDFNGVVIHVGLLQEEVNFNGSCVELSVGAGESWDGLVERSLSNGWYGLENLSAIPGNVGAAPIQNIGAYGVEVSSLISRVEGLHIETDTLLTLNREECEFAYRDSVFKGRLKDEFVITRVFLNLSTQPHCDSSYPALQQTLCSLCLDETPENIATVVRQVRADKLPSPSHMPNVGSFFKNPILSLDDFSKLSIDKDAVPHWPHADGVKLAAGWLVDQAGWRGFEGEGELSGLGVYQHQALVLINPGKCSGERVLSLAGDIIESVRDKFGVTLEIEPRIY